LENGRRQGRVVGLQPVDGVGDAAGADFEPSMALVDILEGLDFIGGSCLEITFDLGVQVRLVVFDRQQKVGLGAQDVLGNGRVAAHSVDGHGHIDIGRFLMNYIVIVRMGSRKNAGECITLAVGT
jgi:hypothetical protein